MNYNLGRKGNVIRAAFSAALLSSALLAPTLLLAAEGESSSTGQAITDTAISTKLRAKLAADSRIHDSDIHVNTTNGEVTLTGTAANSTVKAAATEIARDTDGVRKVDNDVKAVVATTVGDEAGKTARDAGHTVKHAAKSTGEEVTDGYITTKVKAKLLAAKGVASSGISVETENGAVTLTGHVPTAAQERRAIAIARQVKGVKSVTHSGLEIAAE